MLAILPLVLTACGDSIGQIEPPDLATLPEGLARECPAPTQLPGRALTQAEVEVFWATDRKNLRNCADLHRELVAWVRERDTGVTNK